MKKTIKSIVITLIAILTLTAIPYGAAGAVRYMPDVTAEMSSASYWSDKVADPDRVLASVDQIERINQSLCAKGAPLYDMANWQAGTFDGKALGERLAQGVLSDGEYDYSLGVRYNADGKKISWEEAKATIYEPISQNCIDPEATTEMPEQFAIVTNRTCLQSFPSDARFLDDPDDPDFDYNYLSMLHVNDPVVIRAKSADGEYYSAITAFSTGWIRAKDIAICADQQEWFDAWNVPAEKKLVVYDDKIYTEDSNIAPETANRKIPMGSWLVLADEEDINGSINNRTAHNNHVVWMPVRKEDGTFKKELALIGENRKVSEGYLPVTTENIMKVALNQLGDAYGWGGMMGSEDCSGYMRDIYRCFGLELTRSTRDRNARYVKFYSFSGMTDEEKADFIRQLPPGTMLIFPGHEMMYLGQEGDNLYVISSISNIRLPQETSNTRVRGTVINTLGLWRSDNNTWLHHLNYAEIPYYTPDQGMIYTVGEITNGSVSPDNAFPAEGEQATLTAAPDQGYRVKGWTITGVDGEPITYAKAGQNQVSFTMPKVDVQVSATFGPKFSGTLKATAKPLQLKAKNLKKKKRVIARKKAVKISGVQGKLTYTKVKVNKKKFAKKFKVDRKTGKITVRKGVKKGLYKVQIRITDSGNADYKAISKKVTIRIRVK